MHMRKSLTSIIAVAFTVALADLPSERKGKFDFSCPLHQPTATCCKAILRKFERDVPVLCANCKDNNL